ncbi:ATP synthase delta/epsilon chain alpha-helix domain-containing protein, partial [uncultured Dubosiella sp.]
RAYARARERLDKKDEGTNLKRAELSLQKAINRISVHG